MTRRTPIAIACLLAWVSATASSMGMAPRPRSPALLVVPAHHAPLQLGFDVAERYRTALVVYQSQGQGRDPMLHVWDGAKWVRLDMEDFSSLSFMSVRPERILLVGDATLLPSSLVEATSWSTNQFVLPATDAASLVNHFGHFYNFRSADWRWFAGRYNLSLDDINEARRKRSWYDRSADEVPPAHWGRDRELRKATVQMDRESSRAAYDVEAPEVSVEPMESGLTMPPVEVEPLPPPAASVQAPRAVSVTSPSSSGAGGTLSVTPPAGWEERAVATEAPVK